MPEIIEKMRVFADQAIMQRQREFELSHSIFLNVGPSGHVSPSPQARLFMRDPGLPPSLEQIEPRLAIGIDELDKMDPDSASRFLNEIKAMFGIPSCLFLVSVSDEALRIYEQRMLLGRTAFDSAFDEITRVDPLDFDSCRHLLRRRIAGLPDSLIALCQVMSGGVPRDIIRVARSVLDSRARGHEEIPAIVKDLVEAQIRVIRQASRARAASSAPADMLPLHVALYFYGTVAEVFGGGLPTTVKLLRAGDTAADSWIDQLANAWSIMSTYPLLAREMIDKYRAARGLSVPDEPSPGPS